MNTALSIRNEDVSLSASPFAPRKQRPLTEFLRSKWQHCSPGIQLTHILNAMITLFVSQWVAVQWLESPTAMAQERYRLTAPQAAANATARLTANRLEVIDARGQATSDERYSRNDSKD